MKRILIITALFFIFTLNSVAQEDYGQGELMGALPEDVREDLSEIDITPDSAGALGISPFSVIRGLWDLFLGELIRPFRMFAALVGVILLCAAAETLRDSGTGSGTGNSAHAAFEIVGVLAGAGMMFVYVSECLSRAAQTLGAGSVFLMTFVPVFAGIMAICGQLTTASVFSMSLVAAGQVFIYITSVVLTPLTSCILGVSAAGAINPDLKIDNLAGVIKKVVIWILGLLVALFTGLLSLQSFLSTSADTVAMRAARFAVSSSVPFVGGAVTDALSTVKGSLNLVRGSTGTFGIIAGVAIIAPTLISVFCHKIALSAAAAVSSIFGLGRLSSLLKSGEAVMSIVFAMLFCFTLVLVISIALMLMLWNGA